MGSWWRYSCALGAAAVLVVGTVAELAGEAGAGHFPPVDTLISKHKAGPYKGNDIGDGSPPVFPGQTVSRSIAIGAKKSFWVKVQNESHAPDCFDFFGPSGGGGFRVRYFHGDTDITANATGDGESFCLETDKQRRFEVEVKVKNSTSPGSGYLGNPRGCYGFQCDWVAFAATAKA